jgi:release factor glutamine methyltransferase
MDFLQLRAQLADLYDEREAGNIVEQLAEDYFNRRPPLTANIMLSDKEKQDLQEIAARLLKGEPLQYVMGKANFYGYDFLLNRQTLIPRPETEELVYNIVQQVKRMPQPPRRWLEVGTGSGCIAIALKKQLPDIEIIAIDISEDALDIARKNAEIHATNIDFRRVDFLDASAWAAEFAPAAFDAFVSNPPYILPIEQESRMSANTMHEPPAALFVTNNDAQQFYRLFADFVPFLAPSARLWCELNEFEAEGTKAIFAANPNWQDLQIIDDIRKRPRVFCATKSATQREERL